MTILDIHNFRSVGSRFNMGKASLYWCFVRVVNALNEIAHEIIKWPDHGERNAIKNRFRAFAGVEGVVGAIDGKYMSIKAPQEQPQQYINRKCFHAITLQAISLPNLKFIDCFTGYPSSVSDIRVFRNSPIYQGFLQNTNNYFEENEFIIGDKAYPLHKWCIPPYIDRGTLTPAQIYFNKCHTKTRQVVERSFALLVGRFRRLKDMLDMTRMDMIPKTILACCVLHNICLMDPNELIEVYVNDGGEERDGQEHNIGHDIGQRVPGADHFRDRMAHSLYNEYLNNL